MQLHRIENCDEIDAGEKQYKFEEILPIYKSVSADADAGTFADFMEAFKTFDREGQGFINAAELRHVLTSLGMFYCNSLSERKNYVMLYALLIINAQVTLWILWIVDY